MEWLIFGGLVLLGYLLVCAVDPWVDCWWCHGSPKKRSSGSGYALTMLVLLVGLAGIVGLPGGSILIGGLIVWGVISMMSGSNSYHFCSVPGWLGGCGGRGRRRRVGSTLIGMGLGSLD